MPTPEVEQYVTHTPTSKKNYDALSSIIPGGVNTAIQYFPPYPLYMAKGLGVGCGMSTVRSMSTTAWPTAQ